VLARWGSRARSLLTAPHLRVAELLCGQPAGPPGGEHRAEAPWFVVPRRGLVSWQVNGRSHVVVPGRLLWFAPGDESSFGHPADGGDDCLVLAPSARLCAEVLGRVGLSTFSLPSTMVALPAPASLAGEVLLRAAADPDVEAEWLAEYATRYLRTLARALRKGWAEADSITPQEERPESHAELVEQAAVFLAAHYAEPIRRPLDAAAAAVLCSPFHLARVFRREAGCTVHTFRERLRLAAALREIAGGADSFADLARELGYASHSHFSGNFRRAYGVSPGAARLALAESCQHVRRIVEAATVD
jgi:AraC family transcriptional regulator